MSRVVAFIPPRPSVRDFSAVVQAVALVFPDAQLLPTRPDGMTPIAVDDAAHPDMTHIDGAAS